jgi:hypothetical protein
MGDTIERLTRLSTMVQVMLAIGLLLLASHAALWREVGGKLSGAIAAASRSGNTSAPIRSAIRAT